MREMANRKLTVVGGGGVRSMFLAKSLVSCAGRLGFGQIVFMDNDEQKLNIYGKMAREVARRLDPEVEFTLTTDPVEAVRDADYLITTIRAGQDEMRIQDERIALAHGILGQETTGAAGFSFAMRSIPALEKYCALAREYASPGVKIFNFTNPAGVVSQTLRDLGYDFTFGICDAPSELLRSLADVYGVKPEEVTGDCYGLNHLSFFPSIQVQGREVMPGLLSRDEIYQSTQMRFFDKELARHFGCVLNEYLYYYYYRQEAVEHILKAGVTRGEMIRDVNRRMTEELSGMDIEHDFDACLRVFDQWHGKRETAYMANETGTAANTKPFHFDLYAPDNGGYAGVALTYIDSEITGHEAQMILCVPNKGAIPGLRDSDVAEVTCTIRNGEYIPHPVRQPGTMQMELIRQVKCYERLASEAIRQKSIDRAVDCLCVHPLVNSYSLARTLVKEYLEANHDYTEGWK